MQQLQALVLALIEKERERYRKAKHFFKNEIYWRINDHRNAKAIVVR
jgi:hypothetical protein